LRLLVAVVLSGGGTVGSPLLLLSRFIAGWRMLFWCAGGLILTVIPGRGCCRCLRRLAIPGSTLCCLAVFPGSMFVRVRSALPAAGLLLRCPVCFVVCGLLAAGLAVIRAAGGLLGIGFAGCIVLCPFGLCRIAVLPRRCIAAVASAATSAATPSAPAIAAAPGIVLVPVVAVGSIIVVAGIGACGCLVGLFRGAVLFGTCRRLRVLLSGFAVAGGLLCGPLVALTAVVAIASTTVASTAP